MFDLAGTLFGNRRNPVAQGSTLTATGSTASTDGVAGIIIDADVTPAEGTGDEDVDQTVIDLPTSPDVAEGDEVIVTLVGDGPLKTPIVTANPGSGDRMAAAVQDAHDLAASVESIAQEAKDVAEATGQHFWTDNDGVHVTEVTQDEWSDSTSPNYHSGANVLLNALGQLFRDGVNNILAIVSGTDPGVAIYDGEGNAADNIVALFSKALIRIGGRLLGTGTSTASVQFFQSDASQTDITATHAVGSTDPSTGPDDVYGIEHNVRITTTTDGSELPQLAGLSGWAQLDMDAEVNPDYRAGSAILRARVGDDDEFGDGTPQLGVLRQGAANGMETAEIYMAAPTLALHDNAQYKAGRIPMEQAINVLSSPVTLFTGTYAQTHSAAVTLSETAANFSRLVFVCENNDGERTSVTVTDPNGKNFNVVMVTIAGPTGTGTYAYMKAKSFSINGTSVTCRTYTYNGQTIYRHGSVTLRNGVAVAATQASEEIGIVKVLGWR